MLTETAEARAAAAAASVAAARAGLRLFITFTSSFSHFLSFSYQISLITLETNLYAT